MQRFFTFIFVLFSALMCRAEDAMQWVASSHHFGSILEKDGKVSHEFFLVNTSNDPFHITRVRTSCGCTASSFSRKDIQPGDTATVTVTFNPINRPGRFKNSAYIHTNAHEDYSTLTITGNVVPEEKTLHTLYPSTIGALRLERHIIPFGEITKGKKKNQYITVYNPSIDTIEVKFSNLPPHIQARLIPDRVLPNDVATIVVIYRSDRCNQWALTQNSFTVETLPLSPSEHSIAGIGNIEVTAMIVEDFTKSNGPTPIAKTNTNRINLGKVSHSAKASFEICNEGDAPLKIRHIYSLDKNISISYNHNADVPPTQIHKGGHKHSHTRLQANNQYSNNDCYQRSNQSYTNYSHCR